MRKLLFLSKQAPLPVCDGNSLRMWNLLNNLPDCWNVDIVCQRPGEKSDERRLIDAFKTCYFFDLSSLGATNISSFHRALLHTKNIFMVPRTTYHRPIEYDQTYAGCALMLSKKSNYDAILCNSPSIFGLYLYNTEHTNITCDVCDSQSLYINSLMRYSKSKRESLALAYSYFYNILWEMKYLRKCKKIVVISNKDKIWQSRTIKSENIHVIENGVDIVKYNQPGTASIAQEGLIVFVGVMNYEPNHDAMVYFISQVWPLIKAKSPSARLKIIGKNPLTDLVAMALGHSDIEVIGYVDDIAESIADAQVFVCPMRKGAGLKNKILEAFAVGVPVVSTSEGVSGILFNHGETGYVADSPEKMAHYVTLLMGDEKRRKELSEAGKQLVSIEYTWESKGRKLSEVLTT